MGNETLLAMIAAFAIIASAVNVAMSLKMNALWSNFAHRLLDDMNKMHSDWTEFYKKLDDYRIGIVEDEVKEEETWKRS